MNDVRFFIILTWLFMGIVLIIVWGFYICM